MRGKKKRNHPSSHVGAASLSDRNNAAYAELVFKMTYPQLELCVARVRDEIPNWRDGEWAAKLRIAMQVLGLGDDDLAAPDTRRYRKQGRSQRPKEDPAK